MTPTCSKCKEERFDMKICPFHLDFGQKKAKVTRYGIVEEIITHFYCDSCMLTHGCSMDAGGLWI